MLIEDDQSLQLRRGFLQKNSGWLVSHGARTELWHTPACWLPSLLWHSDWIVMPREDYFETLCCLPMGWDFNFRCLISWSFSSIAWWRSACNSFSFRTNSSSNLQERVTLVDGIMKQEVIAILSAWASFSGYSEPRDFIEIKDSMPVALGLGQRGHS